MPAGRFIIRLNGGYLKSSVVSGQDTLDFPLDFAGDRDVTDAVLTVTDRLGGLNGTLTDAMGKPALDYIIVAAATDSRFWGPGSRRVRSTGLSVDGKYDFGALPPGSYQISVVVDPQQGALSDPEFLRAIAATSIPITIMDGIKATQNLRVK